MIVGKSSYDERWAMLLVLPVMAVLAIVAVYPIVHSFYTSLYDIVLTRPHRTPFVGLANYMAGFCDAR
ncbi:MAG: sugar ABC transporter permease, partial [Alphaproteobacteria bacterium]|nr:sugar ABC transporter permease [Alphaproteobacteria bacterium]